MHRITTKIGTGVALVLLTFAAGCGDDEGGMRSPTSPSSVMAPSADTASSSSAQAYGGASYSGEADTLTVDVRSVTPDKRDDRLLRGELELERQKGTHLEPDSFPDARVRSGSNVWRRGNGTGLIRIISDADLSGMSFMTAGSSWSLSQRRPGLYVSEISGGDIERIRAGGGIGGRADEPTAINCWASEAGKEVTVDAVGASIETPVEVTCDRSIGPPRRRGRRKNRRGAFG